MGVTYDLGLWGEGGWDGLLGVSTPPAAGVATLSRPATGAAILAARPQGGTSSPEPDPSPGIAGALGRLGAGNSILGTRPPAGRARVNR